MRKVINISLPHPVVKTVKTAVKKGGYASTSEFFRDLLRNWQKDKLLEDLNESRAGIIAKKGRVLKSLKDLR